MPLQPFNLVSVKFLYKRVFYESEEGFGLLNETCVSFLVRRHRKDGFFAFNGYECS